MVLQLKSGDLKSFIGMPVFNNLNRLYELYKSNRPLTSNEIAERTRIEKVLEESGLKVEKIPDSGDRICEEYRQELESHETLKFQVKVLEIKN